MASMATFAQDHPPLLVVSNPQPCAHCRALILSGERWVREKILKTADDARYHRYHADLFPGEDLSCWEKHQMAREIAEKAEPVAYA